MWEACQENNSLIFRPTKGAAAGSIILESALEKALEKVLGLAQRLPLHRPQVLVPRNQRGELLLLNVIDLGDL